jgi:hypothetical protein
MVHCANSFPHQISLACIIFLVGLFAVAAQEASGQTRPADEPFEKVSLKTAPPCEIPVSGEITALIKNGVELTVTEDWDCDGIADAYDNCVGMPNPEQTDSDGNRIGDVCEAATLIKAGVAINSRSSGKVRTDAKAKRPSAKARDRDAKANDRNGKVERRNAKFKTRNEKAKSRKSEAKSRNTKVERRNAGVLDKRPSSGTRKRRRS